MEVFLSKPGGSIHRPIKNEHAWVPCTSLYSHVRHLVSTKTDLLKLKSSSSHGNLKQHHTNAVPQCWAAYLSQQWGCRVTEGKHTHSHLLPFYRSLKNEIKTQTERFTSVLGRCSNGTLERLWAEAWGRFGVDQNEKWRHSKRPGSLRMFQIDYFAH